jgi:hypothetical protein
MANPKMIILRGNAAPAGMYPDEQGKTPAWPNGALHVKAAKDYATREGFDPVVLDVGGFPQSQDSPQATAALREFHKDDRDVGFYGFSGGGYNVRHILEYFTAKEPQSLRRIKRVVVIGAPFDAKATIFAPGRYIARVADEVKSNGWQAPDWVVVYRENPDKSQVPKGLEEVDPHMFGPAVLLTGANF